MFLRSAELVQRACHTLFLQDVIKFGFSSREYVILHENTQTADSSDSEMED